MGFGPPALAAAGDGAAAALPGQHPAAHALPLRTVLVTVGAALLVLAAVLVFSGRLPWRSRAAGEAPVLGVIGQAVRMGGTALGVAFVGAPERLNGRPARHGRYLAVGVVVGNQGRETVQLEEDAFALTDGDAGGEIAPLMIAYGTPEDLSAGRYAPAYILGPGQTIAAVALFDIATSLTSPRLLVRDYHRQDHRFTGAIDLTREADRSTTMPRWNVVL